jgi:hypothetical protein
MICNVIDGRPDSIARLFVDPQEEREKILKRPSSEGEAHLSSPGMNRAIPTGKSLHSITGIFQGYGIYDHAYFR